MKCNACLKELSRKEIVYTEDKQGYCPNPFTCNDNHPNSVSNILTRGAAVKLYTEDELEDNIFERHSISEEMKDRILKVATKPQSIRLSKYEIAYYLLALQDEEDLQSISEAVRFCVNLAMDVRPIGKKGKIVPRQPQGEPTIIEVVEATPANVEEVQEQAVENIVKSEGIKFVVPDMPKSINVDWSKVEKTVKKEDAEETKEEEEEFTF